MATKGINMSFFYNDSGSKRQSKEWKLAGVDKKKSRAKVMLPVFWDTKGSISIDFLEKGATVNSVSYYQQLRQNSSYLLRRF